MAIIIADIHGNVEKVKAFLDYKPGVEHVCLGDIVDSEIEPPSRQIECLNLLFDSGAVLLWGNHDIQYSDILYTYPCSGYIQGNPVPDVVRENQHRFKAAYAVGGYLLTHAGVCSQISRGCTDPVELAENFNQRLLRKDDTPEPNLPMGLAQALLWSHEQARLHRDPIFYVSKHRGGRDEFSGIFWFDPFCEDEIDPGLRQIYGHCETNVKPEWNELGHLNLNYYGRDVCYLFDTELGEIVEIKINSMGTKILRKQFDREVSRRISGNYYNINWRKELNRKTSR